MNTFQTLTAPLGRLLLASIFILSGLQKIGGYAGTQAYMESAGVPGALLPAVIAVEVLGGLAIVFGWHTRIAAFVLAGFALASGLLFHFNFADPAEATQFLKNLAIAGAFLVLVAHGSGAYALDARRPS